MAPPKTYAENNPATLSFVKVQIPYVDSNGKNAVRIDYRPKPGTGYDILTEDVLNSGNLKLLRKFQKDHKEELNAPKNKPAKRYIEARIKTAEKFELMEQKAKLDLAQKKLPPKLEVDEKDGFIGLSSIKYPAYQTSANGCWSISTSMLLKSRGVDLSQEEIRQWRPDYKEDALPAEKANPERKRVMNADAGNSIYPNADLIGKVLPNTAVNMLHIEPFETEQLSIDGKPLDEQQQEIVRNEYYEQVKSNLQNTIRNALTVHKSPVSAGWDGHFITITGISPDGKTIRYEESLGAESRSKRTRTMSTDELVKQSLSAHMHNGVYYGRGYGIELTWLSDIPVAEHGKDAQEPLFAEGKDYVKENEDGTVSIDIPNDVQGISASGSPYTGQVDGKGVERMMVLDQTKLAQSLGVPKIDGWGPGGGIMLGSTNSYFPKKVLHPGDPALLKESLVSQKKAISEIKGGVNYIINSVPSEEELKKANKFKKTISDIEALAKGKDGDFEKSKVELQEMIDYFAEKPQGAKGTRFEKFFYNMNDSSRKRFVKGLQDIDQSLGLGKGKEIGKFAELHKAMKLDYETKHAEAQKQAEADLEFRRSVKEYWDIAKQNADGSLMDSPRRRQMHGSLAMIAASYTLHQKMVDEGNSSPYPKKTDVTALANKILKSEAFQNTVTGLKGYMVDPKSTPADFVADYAENLSQIEARKRDVERYKISEGRLEKVQQRTGRIADSLLATGTGSYTGMGIISRFKNSTKYENALKAISDFSKKANPSAQDTKTYVDTVLRYLDGKEKVRTRGFGRDRWNYCMKFLAQTMPRDVFQDYCDKINQKRGVGPESKDYVGPETFYPDFTFSRHILSDSRNRIRRGDGSLRDYARIIAVRRLSDDGGTFDTDDLYDSAGSRHQLRRETDTILADPRFKDFINSKTDEELNDMLNNEDATGLWDSWETHKEFSELAENVKGPKNAKDEMPIVNAPQP